MAASRLLAGECEDADTDKEQWIPLIGKALYTFKICTYAQGFDLLYTASRVYNWNMNLGEIAKIWRGGCIIRAQFLNHITSLYEKNPDVRNLIFDEYFKDSVAAGLPACRRIVAAAAMSGVPLPCFSATLSYYDGLRSPFLPANLIQAQRDFFGAHTYERADKPGVFHTQWE
jgi:6-phosphogluconate dehydrogenase